MFAAIAATQMLLGSQTAAARQLPGAAPLFAVGGVIAGVASLAGVGGASIAVPFMTWCSVPMRHAIDTASAFGLPIALGGAAGRGVIAPPTGERAEESIRAGDVRGRGRNARKPVTTVFACAANTV